MDKKWTKNLSIICPFNVHHLSIIGIKPKSLIYRVKGRDWYDLIWFIRRKVPLNLTLYAKLNGYDEILSRAAFLKMAKERIDRLDVASAIEDIIHFVRDQEAIKKMWSKEFFHHWIDNIQTIPK